MATRGECILNGCQTGAEAINWKQLMQMQLVSVVRLQDFWSSGCAIDSMTLFLQVIFWPLFFAQQPFPVDDIRIAGISSIFISLTNGIFDRKRIQAGMTNNHRMQPKIN